MSFLETIRNYFGRSTTPVEPVDPADPFDMRAHVQSAYRMLVDANKKAIQIPADVISVITEARRATGPELPDGLEARFWNAYGLLSSTIRPAERARAFYRWTFVIVLLVLLIGQFFFLAGDSVRAKLVDTEAKIVELKERGVSSISTDRTTPPAAPSKDPKSNTAQPPDQSTPTDRPATNGAVQERIRQQRLQELLEIQSAYEDLATNLVQMVVGVANAPFFWISRPEVLSTPGEFSFQNMRVVRGQLDMILVFLSGYLLPLLYGLLGACAFVLRKLSDEIDKLTYAHDMRVRYSLRLNIGMLSGLAVGWFIKPGPGDTTFVSLSPLALAFIAGYGSELFFVALDKIVQAFVPAGGAATSVVKEVTAGGIITTQSQTKETHVAGPTGKDGPPTQPVVDGRTVPTPDASQRKVA